MIHSKRLNFWRGESESVEGMYPTYMTADKRAFNKAKSSSAKSVKLAVLISGNGSNLQALIDAILAGSLHAEIVVVLSNRADAYGLIRAEQANIPTHILDLRTHSKADLDHALLTCLAPYQPDLVILAGFMKILGPDFIQQYPKRILNIHPSLLPKHKGLHTHEAVLHAHESEHGATVHIVTEALDDGDILGQALLKVNPDDTAETLKKRVHVLEHELYPAVIEVYGKSVFK